MNGGLTNIDDCIEQLKYLDGVMVGRAVQANLFIKDVDHIFMVKVIFKLTSLMS